jgi:hypothetical protein
MIVKDAYTGSLNMNGAVLQRIGFTISFFKTDIFFLTALGVVGWRRTDSEKNNVQVFKNENLP